MEGQGRFPHVLGHMDEIDQDPQGDIPLAGQLLQDVQLREIAVDQSHPCFAMPRIPVLGLVEHRRDDLLRRALQAGPRRVYVPVAAGLRSSRALSAGARISSGVRTNGSMV